MRCLFFLSLCGSTGWLALAASAPPALRASALIAVSSDGPGSLQAEVNKLQDEQALLAQVKNLQGDLETSMHKGDLLTQQLKKEEDLSARERLGFQRQITDSQHRDEVAEARAWRFEVGMGLEFLAVVILAGALVLWRWRSPPECKSCPSCAQPSTNNGANSGDLNTPRDSLNTPRDSRRRATPRGLVRSLEFMDEKLRAQRLNGGSHISTISTASTAASTPRTARSLPHITEGKSSIPPIPINRTFKADDQAPLVTPPCEYFSLATGGEEGWFNSEDESSAAETRVSRPSAALSAAPAEAVMAYCDGLSPRQSVSSV